MHQSEFRSRVSGEDLFERRARPAPGHKQSPAKNHGPLPGISFQRQFLRYAPLVAAVVISALVVVVSPPAAVVSLVPALPVVSVLDPVVSVG